MNPNDPRIVTQRGELRIWRGQPEASLEWIDLAMKLDPRDADRRAGTKGLALLMMGNAEGALPLMRRNPRPAAFECALRAAAFVAAGDEASVAHAREHALEGMPALTASLLANKLPFEHEADRARVRDWLLAAGFAP